MIRTVMMIWFVVVMSLAGLAGCTTMRVTMSPKPPNEIVGERLPFKVGLYLDNEFQGYHWHGTSGAEMSQLDYDLGAASKSLLLETFMRCARGVTFVDKRPPHGRRWPRSDGGDRAPYRKFP